MFLTAKVGEIKFKGGCISQQYFFRLPSIIRSPIKICLGQLWVCSPVTVGRLSPQAVCHVIWSGVFSVIEIRGTVAPKGGCVEVRNRNCVCKGPRVHF